MSGGFPWSPPFGWHPSYWNQNQNQQPWAWHVRDPYWNQRTGFRNVGWNAGVPQPGGLMVHPPRPIGRPPRPPPPQRRIVSSGSQSSNSSGQHRCRDLDRDAGKRLRDECGKTPFLPPKKRAEFKSQELHRGQHGNGSDDNSSKSVAEKPLDPVQETPDPPPASSTKTGLAGSLVPPAVSAPAPLESTDVDVCMTERNNNQGDVLGLDGYMEKKRLLSKTRLADAEGEIKVTTKKTRLGWGQGLAKYEKQLKQENGQKLEADGGNETEKVLTAPASSYRPTPTPGTNVDLGNNSTNTTEMMVSEIVVPASSRECCPLTGDFSYKGNSSTSLTETVIRHAEVTDVSHKHSLQPDNHKCLVYNVGGRCNPSNDSMSMTETVTCTATVPTSSHGSSPPPAVGGNSDHCNRISSMTETVVLELASSNRCDPPAAAGLGKKRMSLTESVISPPESAFSDSSSTCLPPGANGVHGNSTSLLAEKVVQPPDAPPPRKCSALSAAGDNGALGNSSTSLTAVTVVNPATVLASSDGFNLPPDDSNAKSIKVQDIPQELISQPINEIQNSAGMPAIIIKKLQKPREFLNKNIVFKEPQTNDLLGSAGFKTWSQEEKDVFAEKFTAIGTDFTKISSFLSHKTPTDCIEYYSKHYKSKCSKKSNKCLQIIKQSQEKCKNVNDAAPYMSGIATVPATKTYKRKKTVEEDLKKPAKQICHESMMTHLQSHSHPDNGHHVEASIEEYERVTGNVGEMNATSLQGMNSPFTNSGEAASLTIPKTEVAELKNLSEDSCSNEETRKGEQEIWTKKERCHFMEAIEMHGMDFSSISAYVGTKSIQQCKIFLSNCKNDLNLGKKHVSSNSTVDTNVDSATCTVQSYSKVKENVPQQVTGADHGVGENYQAGGSSGQGNFGQKSGQGNSEIIMSLSERSQTLPNITTEDCQIIDGERSPEVCAMSKEYNDDSEHSWNDETETNSNTNVDNNAPSDMENPRSDNNPYIATKCAELSGHDELVQPLLEDSEGLMIGSKENNDKAIRDEKITEHTIASREGSGIHLGCIGISQRDKEVVDIISSPEGRDLNVPLMLASDGASKNSNLSSTSSSAALQIVYAKTSHGEVDIDLNIPHHDVAPLDLASVAFDNNCAEASMELHKPLQTTDVAEIIEHESSIRARATNDMGGDSEGANDVTHVQEIHQSQTTVAETGHHPENQPGCIKLFGQVIYQAPSSSSGRNLKSLQGNQFVARSTDMPCATTDVPLRAGGCQLYPSRPSIWRSAPVNLGQQIVLSDDTINLGQQTVLSNNTMNLDQQTVLPNTTMPYGSSNSAAPWRPLQFGSSALVNMSQQRQYYVHMMMRYSMMRGGVVPGQGSSSTGGLVNFNNFNQQQWPNDILDADRLVMGNPCLPGSTQNQAPTAIVPSGINIEVASTSNTGFSAAGRGRGREGGRGRAAS